MTKLTHTLIHNQPNGSLGYGIIDISTYELLIFTKVPLAPEHISTKHYDIYPLWRSWSPNRTIIINYGPDLAFNTSDYAELFTKLVDAELMIEKLYKYSINEEKNIIDHNENEMELEIVEINSKRDDIRQQIILEWNFLSVEQLKQKRIEELNTPNFNRITKHEFTSISSIYSQPNIYQPNVYNLNQYNNPNIYINLQD